jgi:hypothetical protein
VPQYLPCRKGADPPVLRGRKEIEEMLERLLDIEVTRDGTVIEEIELICCMTGFRRRFLVEYISGGFYRSVELGAG